MNVEDGKTVCFHYVGTLEDGTEFDNSRTRGEPLVGHIGQGHLIPGFESALMGMGVGEKKSVVVESKDAYGEYNEDAIQTVPLERFPSDFTPQVGGQVQGENSTGQTFNATITDSTESDVTLDFNHPLAGKSLSFEIEVVSIANPSSEPENNS